MDKIAVIGSGGCLGTALVKSMEGCYVRQVDISIRNAGDTQRGDVRSTEDMQLAVEGMDAVIYLVAWHGGYQPMPTNETRFDTNVIGTFRVLQACLKYKVRHLVFASSIAVHSPFSFYGTTKILCEDLCRHYHLAHDFHIAIMRYGAFTPCDLQSYGVRLLNRGVDLQDCVNATLAALQAVREKRIGLKAYTILASHPFSDLERASFGKDPRQIIHRYWPTHEGLLNRYTLDIPAEVHEYDPEPAFSDLGWKSQHDFGTFLDELSHKDKMGFIHPDSPRWSFETGTKPPVDVIWPNSYQ